MPSIFSILIVVQVNLSRSNISYASVRHLRSGTNALEVPVPCILDCLYLQAEENLTKISKYKSYPTQS